MAINKVDEVVIAPSLKAIIDAKAEKTYVDNIHTNIENEISSIVSNMDWKQAVATYADIATTYPSPQDGWVVNVQDTDYTYRYDGTLKVWIPISANSIPIVSQTVDGKMSKEDKIKLDNIQANAQVNPTASDILNELKTVDGMGSGLDANLLDGQGSSYYLDYAHFSNIPDIYTKTEINTQMNGKVDKISGKGLSTNDFNDDYKTKLDGISTNAKKVSSSTTNGNIKIDDVETTVYTLEAHKHVKADITDFPASMPANGGNADTLDNIDSTGFFRTGIEILSNADLNDYMTEGNYFCRLNVIAQTILNMPPTKEAFMLTINKYYTSYANKIGVMQTWKHYKSNTIYFRVYNTDANTWTSWAQIALKSDIPSIPTKVSQLTNDGDGTSSFVTASQLGDAGYGDMTKATYDADNDGVVDKAEDSNTLGGKSSSDFAPSGYGLGGIGKRLGSGIDANTVINNGWYDINNSTNLPSDIGTGYAKLLVICSADINYITQLAFSMTTGTVGTMYIREKRVNTWGSWIRIANMNDIAFTNLLNKPTTLSGYGITDGALKTDVQDSVQNSSTQPTNQMKGGIWLAPI